jgi:hypothetical protein
MVTFTTEKTGEVLSTNLKWNKILSTEDYNFTIYFVWIKRLNHNLRVSENKHAEKDAWESEIHEISEEKYWEEHLGYGAIRWER